MKYTTLTVLLLALLATSTYTADTCCTDCLKNIKTDGDKQDGEEAIPAVTTEATTPKTTGFDKTKICGKVFETDGACCDQTTLKAFHTAWINRLKKRYFNLRKSVRKYRKASKIIERLTKKLAKNKKKFLKGKKPARKEVKKPKKSGSRRILSIIRQLAEVANTEADFTKLEKGLKAQETNKADIDKATKAFDKGGAFGQCFKTLAKMRTNLLCKRCSGKATALFDATTDSYKMKDNVCPKIIEHCGAVYGVLANAKKFAVMVNDLSVALGKKSNSKVSVVEIDDEEIAKWVTCGKDAKACSTGSNVAELCQTFALAGEPNKAESIDAGATAADATDAIPDSAARRALRILTDAPSVGYIQIDAAGADINVIDSGVAEEDFVDIGEEGSNASKFIISTIAVLLLQLF